MAARTSKRSFPDACVCLARAQHAGGLCASRPLVQPFGRPLWRGGRLQHRQLDRSARARLFPRRWHRGRDARLPPGGPLLVRAGGAVPVPLHTGLGGSQVLAAHRSGPGRGSAPMRAREGAGGLQGHARAHRLLRRAAVLWRRRRTHQAARNARGGLQGARGADGLRSGAVDGQPRPQDVQHAGSGHGCDRHGRAARHARDARGRRRARHALAAGASTHLHDPVALPLDLAPSMCALYRTRCAGRSGSSCAASRSTFA
jgi:hypothetical protein